MDLTLVLPGNGICAKGIQAAVAALPQRRTENRGFAGFAAGVCREALVFLKALPAGEEAWAFAGGPGEY